MTAAILPFRRPMSAERATELVRAAAKDENSGKLLGWSNHVWPQMAKRKLSDREVLSTLQGGEIKAPPVWDEEYQDWVCTFVKKYVSGRSVKVVVGIVEGSERVTVVTAC